MSFNRYDFLAKVREHAKNQQEVLDFLGLPSSRGRELFDPTAEKPRHLKVEEAVALSEAFDVPIGGASVSADQLIPVLTVCLRREPDKWDPVSIRKLAEEISLGLRFNSNPVR